MSNLQLRLYAPYMKSAADGLTIWNASIKLTLTLHTSSYTPNYATHDFVNDLTNELGSGSGYTAGGVVLANATSTVVAANSWGQTWAATTAYLIGQIRRPTTGNGFVYKATANGTSAGSEPTWPTVIGQCVTDGTTAWVCAGREVVMLDADNLAPAWAAFSAGPFRYVVLSDRAQALAANQPLIGVFDFGSDQTGGGGAFDITFDAGGVIAIPVP